MFRSLALVSGLALAGCSGVVPGAGSLNDAGEDAGEDGGEGTQVQDGGPPDAGEGPASDAGLGDAGVEFDAGTPCPSGLGSASYVCSDDGASRLICQSSVLVSEACSRGCLKKAGTVSDVCLTTSYAWSCTGTWGTEKSTSGDYDLTAFGCWKDANGVVHTDPGDNCIPTCLAQAKSAGVCPSSDTGPQCEERVTWFTADAARFGCLARLKITNPKNGKSVIAVALDYGPNCSVESQVKFPALDASGRINRYLFGSDQGIVDRALVHVVEVASSTPLGPVP